MLGIFMGGFVVFAVLTPRGLPNGDAAVYAQQVIGHDFASRPVHLGYYLLAALGTFVQPLPDRYFNLLSAFLSAGTAFLVWRLSLRLFPGRRRLAQVPVLALLGNVFFLENAVHAEVYAAQTFFLVLAFWLWLRDGGGKAAFLAGLAFGAAGLMTPSSALFAPAFLLIRRPRLVPLLILGGAAAAMMLPILPLAQDYFYGDRGLLAAAGQGLSPLRIAAKEGFELGLGFLALAPLMLLGGWRAAKDPALRPLLAALLAAWAAILLLGERFADVPAQLPVWTLAALLAGCGVVELEEKLASSRAWWPLACLAAAAPVAALLLLRGRASSLDGLPVYLVLAALAAIAVAAGIGWKRLAEGGLREAVIALVAVTVLANALLACALVKARNWEIDSYRVNVLALGEVAAPDFLAIGSWERGILLEHYLYRRSYTEHFLNTAWLAGGWGAERQASAEAALAAAIAEGRQIWLLGPAPGPEARLAAAGYTISEERGSLRVAERVPVAGGEP